jgi:hypothetical protein
MENDEEYGGQEYIARLRACEKLSEIDRNIAEAGF